MTANIESSSENFEDWSVATAIEQARDIYRQWNGNTRHHWRVYREAERNLLISEERYAWAGGDDKAPPWMWTAITQAKKRERDALVAYTEASRAEHDAWKDYMQAIVEDYGKTHP